MHEIPTSRPALRVVLTALAPGRARRGAALLIALFMLLLLSGMGLIAMQSAVQEVQASGNHRLNHQAHYAAEAALMTTFGMLSDAGGAFWVSLRRGAGFDNAASARPEVTLNDVDFQGRLFVAPTGDALTLDPRAQVRVHSPIDGQTAIGYSTDHCFKRLAFHATARVGRPAASITADDRHARAATRAFMAQGLLGPIECEGN